MENQLFRTHLAVQMFEMTWVMTQIFLGARLWAKSCSSMLWNSSKYCFFYVNIGKTRAPAEHSNSVFPVVQLSELSEWVSEELALSAFMSFSWKIESMGATRTRFNYMDCRYVHQFVYSFGATATTLKAPWQGLCESLRRRLWRGSHISEALRLHSKLSHLLLKR